MVQFRPQAREIIAKIVYYGPPLGGKTTNLRTLYRGYPPETRGELMVVPAGGDRTIFFDFLPVDAGTLRGMKLRVQLYTVPGQVHYNATRQVVLRGADGVVFVADSQREMIRSNRESFENLKDNMLLQGIAIGELPHVLQYNKRDLADILSVEEMDGLLNEFNAPFYEAVATVGIGVEETLQGIVKLVGRSLRDRFRVPLEASTGEPMAVAPPPPHVAAPSEVAPDESARIFSFAAPAPPPRPAKAPPSGDVFSAEPPMPEAEITHKVVITPVARLALEETAVLGDPFETPALLDARTGADVFEFPIPEAEREEPKLEPPHFVEPGEVPAEEISGKGGLRLPSFESAIQRAVPRALAQIGDVRELEVEVPVPSAWTGGRRLTLQLRLTLVPEEDEHAG